jgi:hypothetical protein
MLSLSGQGQLRVINFMRLCFFFVSKGTGRKRSANRSLYVTLGLFVESVWCSLVCIYGRLRL